MNVGSLTLFLGVI